MGVTDYRAPFAARASARVLGYPFGAVHPFGLRIVGDRYAVAAGSLYAPDGSEIAVAAASGQIVADPSYIWLVAKSTSPGVWIAAIEGPYAAAPSPDATEHRAWLYKLRLNVSGEAVWLEKHNLPAAVTVLGGFYA